MNNFEKNISNNKLSFAELALDNSVLSNFDVFKVDSNSYIFVITLGRHTIHLKISYKKALTTGRHETIVK